MGWNLCDINWTLYIYIGGDTTPLSQHTKIKNKKKCGDNSIYLAHALTPRCSYKRYDPYNEVGGLDPIRFLGDVVRLTFHLTALIKVSSIYFN